MDSRFHLKIKFSIYGEDFEWDCSLNWDDSHGLIDDRIVEWFYEKHNIAKAKWDEENYEFKRQNEQQKIIAEELELLKRLKEKYPNI